MDGYGIFEVVSQYVAIHVGQHFGIVRCPFTVFVDDRHQYIEAVEKEMRVYLALQLPVLHPCILLLQQLLLSVLNEELNDGYCKYIEQDRGNNHSVILHGYQILPYIFLLTKRDVP